MNDTLPAGPARPAAPAAGGRDLLVDMLRGLALVFIVIDHINVIGRELGDTGLARVYTLIDVQLADAAEIFVFLSGYVLGLVHGSPGRRLGPADLARWTLRRMIQLFGAYVLTIVVMAALYAALLRLGPLPAAWVEAGDLAMLHAPGLDLLAGMTGLTVTLFFINILLLYILLLGYALPMQLLWHRAPAAAAGIAIAIWLIAQFIAPESMPNEAGMRAFNPLGWQLLFCTGMFLGTRRWLDSIRNRPRPGAVALALVIVAAAFLLRLGISRYAPGHLPAALIGIATFVAGDAKPALGPARLIDFAALVYLAWTLLPPVPRLMRWRAARVLAMLGSHSLEVFCIGTVLIMLGSLALHRAGGGVFAYVAVIAAVLVVYPLAGRITAWLLAKPPRRAPAYSEPALPARR